MARDAWEHVPLHEVIAHLEAGVSVVADDRPALPGEPGVLKVSAVGERGFAPGENKAVVLPAERNRLQAAPRKGDVLISRSNTANLVGASAVVDQDCPCLYLPDKLWRVVLKDPNRDSSRWLYYVLSLPSVRNSFRKLANGTSGSMKNISQNSFLGIEIERPSATEQRDIVAALQQWDLVATQIRDLIQAKRQLRKGLAQQLLSGRCRFPEFSGEWSHRRLHDVTEHLTARNKGDLSVDSVKAVTKRHGLIPMKDNVRAASLYRYKRVPPKAFAYNPMRLNIGSITMSGEAVDVLVSPDYVVFRCRDGELDPDYLNHLRRTHAWKHFVKIAGNGSVRVRIYYKDLAAMPLHLPSIEEQRRIASVLNACDQEIRLLKAKLELLKEQKKGLMQQLLTGKIRVKEAEA